MSVWPDWKVMMMPHDVILKRDDVERLAKELHDPENEEWRLPIRPDKGEKMKQLLFAGAVVGIVALFILFSVQAGFELGQKKICENSGGELFQEKDGTIRCTDIQNVPLCRTDTGQLQDLTWGIE